MSVRFNHPGDTAIEISNPVLGDNKTVEKRGAETRSAGGTRYYYDKGVTTYRLDYEWTSLSPPEKAALEEFFDTTVNGPEKWFFLTDYEGNYWRATFEQQDLEFTTGWDSRNADQQFTIAGCIVPSTQRKLVYWATKVVMRVTSVASTSTTTTTTTTSTTTVAPTTTTTTTTTTVAPVTTTTTTTTVAPVTTTTTTTTTLAPETTTTTTTTTTTLAPPTTTTTAAPTTTTTTTVAPTTTTTTAVPTTTTTTTVCNDCAPALPEQMCVTLAGLAGTFAQFNGSWTVTNYITCFWRLVGDDWLLTLWWATVDSRWHIRVNTPSTFNCEKEWEATNYLCDPWNATFAESFCDALTCVDTDSCTDSVGATASVASGPCTTTTTSTTTTTTTTTV